MSRTLPILGAILLLTILLTVSFRSRTQRVQQKKTSLDNPSLVKDSFGGSQPPFRRYYPDNEKREFINRVVVADLQTDPQTPVWKAAMVKTLTEAGWSQPALKRVVELNADWFEMMARADSDSFNEQLRCLKRLGNRPRVMDFLIMFPETAGLLATTDDPEEIVEILDTDNAKQTLLMGLFVRYLGRRDINALTTALKRNRDLIYRLMQRGLVGAEVLFIFSRTGLGTSEYEKWLQDNLHTRLAGSDNDLASFVQFALLQGRDILDKLNKEESFRKNFRNEMWPKLLRVVSRNNESLEYYMDTPELWQLLALDQGEALLERRGMLAVALLFGPDAYPKEFQDQVIKILLSGDGVTFQALTEGRFRNEESFRNLLNRPLSGPVLAAALNKLFQQGTDYRPLLEKFNRLSDEALAEEVGPPPEGVQTWLPFYTHYKIARKLWQGRDITTEEWLEAGVDTVIDVTALFVPLAKSGKIVKQTVKNTGKVVSKELARETIELGIKSARKKLGKEAFEQFTKAGLERQARKWAITDIFSEMQRSYRSMIQVIENSTSFDITEPVKFFYKQSNFDRESYKRLTGLEARVFMRRDAKVFIHVDRLASDPAKYYLNNWLTNTAKETITEEVEDHKWRRHVAAWWLLNTGDQNLVPAK